MLAPVLMLINGSKAMAALSVIKQRAKSIGRRKKQVHQVVLFGLGERICLDDGEANAYADFDVHDGQRLTVISSLEITRQKE